MPRVLHFLATKNTLKVMLGCTPRWAVSYVSDANCDSAGDI